MTFKAIFLAPFFLIAASGQTAMDFEKKYGTQTYHEIRPKILMSAKFASDGEVCRVSFQPNNFSRKTRTVFSGESGLDVVQLKEAIEEVVPKEWRSGQIKPPPLGFEISGSAYWGRWQTEYITIEMTGSSHGGSDINFCEVFGTKPSDLARQKFPFCTMSGTLGLLEIIWNKRGCGKPSP